MYKRLLVALDMSKDTSNVFNSAKTLAQSTGACLMLLHVLSGEEESAPIPIPAVSPLDFYEEGTHAELYEENQEQLAEFEKRGIEMLRSWAEVAQDEGIQAEFSQQPGNVGRKICEVAKSWDADTIIIGRRGYSGFQEMLLGSASNYVVHHAPCFVMVVH